MQRHRLVDWASHPKKSGIGRRLCRCTELACLHASSGGSAVPTYSSSGHTLIHMDIHSSAGPSDSKDIPLWVRGDGRRRALVNDEDVQADHAQKSRSIWIYRGYIET